MDMGILKSIFGGKKEEPKLTIRAEIVTDQREEAPPKKVDVFFQDLVLLSVAENYMVGEKKYPEYFRSRFGIGFPNERFQKLEKDGFIRQSTAIESLLHLKATDLKVIASQLGLKTSGKKEELLARIAENTREEDLAGSVPERYWIVTGKGREVLEENEYISFYMDKHPYYLESIGLDINTYSRLFADNPNGKVRDVIWGEFNRRSEEYYTKGMTKGEFRDYCDLLRTMALFLEEGGSHNGALTMYMRYIHYRANFDAALSAINYYTFSKDVDAATDILYSRTQIHPFIADEIQTISAGCGFDSKQLYSFMKEVFSKEKDTGVFSTTELTELVMCGLNGDQVGQKQICGTAMKSAVKKLQRKR